MAEWEPNDLHVSNGKCTHSDVFETKEIMATEEKNEKKLSFFGTFRKFSKSQWKTLIILGFGNFNVGVITTLQGPFFPREAEARGVSPTVYGLIFGVHELTIFAVSLLVGKLFSLVRGEVILNWGLFLLGTSCLCFGFLDYTYDKNVFVSLAFTLRIVEGIGAGVLRNAINALNINSFPNHMSVAFAVLQSMLCAGLISGPSVGSALYDVNGFRLPFFAFGCLALLNGLVSLRFYPSSKTESQVKKSSNNSIKYWLHPSTITYALVILASFSFIGFNDALLETHLRPLGLIQTYIGLIFACSSVTETIMSLAVGWFIDKKILRISGNKDHYFTIKTTNATVYFSRVDLW